MSDGKLFHAVGPATQNARLPRCRLRGTRDDKVSTSCCTLGTRNRINVAYFTFTYVSTFVILFWTFF